MKKHIDRFKKRSEKERKQIARVFAGIVTLCIVAIWILVLVFVEPNNDTSHNTRNDFELLKKELQELGGFSKVEKNVLLNTVHLNSNKLPINNTTKEVK